MWELAKEGREESTEEEGEFACCLRQSLSMASGKNGSSLFLSIFGIRPSLFPSLSYRKCCSTFKIDHAHTSFNYFQ
jgi:hypothetical protein